MSKRDEPKKITDADILRELTEEILDEETVFRIVNQMDRSYVIHRIHMDNDCYFVGTEGEYGLAVYGSTDLIDVINIMETYLFNEITYPYEDVEFVIPYMSSMKNLIN